MLIVDYVKLWKHQMLACSLLVAANVRKLLGGKYVRKDKILGIYIYIIKELVLRRVLEGS